MRRSDGAENHRADRTADCPDGREAQRLDGQRRLLIHFAPAGKEILLRIVRFSRSKIGMILHDGLRDRTVWLAGRESRTG